MSVVPCPGCGDKVFPEDINKEFGDCLYCHMEECWECCETYNEYEDMQDGVCDTCWDIRMENDEEV